MKTNEHLHTGARGEDAASDFLQAKGYILLHRNWKQYPHEIDLIALHGNTLVFAEVKTRSTSYFGKPEDAVSPAKQSRLQAAAEAYLEEYPHNGEIRFDVIAVVNGKHQQDIHHIEDAFFPGDVW
jgi:putative endonuclease